MDDARNDLLDLLCILLNSNASDERSGYLPRMLPCMPIVRSWLTLLGRKAMVGVLPLIGASFSWLSLLSRTPPETVLTVDRILVTESRARPGWHSFG